MTTPKPLRINDRDLAAKSLEHLESVVRIDSSSDEGSETIPSTPGQAELAEHLRGFFEALGASVTVDDYANLIAALPGRGAGADKAPLALLVHLDTARGTYATDALTVVPRWDGSTLAFEANPDIQVNTALFPSLQAYVGYDVVHGPGDAPFGLDDKLGLTHMMTLAWALAQQPDLDHPPLLLIARPDEEIGRMEALKHVAATLAARGVPFGYTLDGLDPFEINLENFNAKRGSVIFRSRTPRLPRSGEVVRALVGGVNTHGATAWAEGHRTALRLLAEVWHVVGATPGVIPIHLATDPERDCDAVADFHCATPQARAALLDALHAAVAPHAPRGASLVTSFFASNAEPDGAAADVLAWVYAFLFEDHPGFTLPAEDSHGRDGYSHPERALPTDEGIQVDVRLRDFDPEQLQARVDHLRLRAGSRACKIAHQYINMGPRLLQAPHLVRYAQDAAQAVGVTAPVQPIRGGTGVDPFLEHNIPIANLGTGYFAPESEKELTSLHHMALHVRWLVALVQGVAQGQGAG